jgi:hypothetical protein
MKTLLIILSIASLATIGLATYAFYLFQQPKASPEIVTRSASVTGEVLAVDAQMIASDGPFIVIIQDNRGEAYRIEVPSMGINLCPAAPYIDDVTLIKPGSMISVRGFVQDSVIVPCEQEDHSLRIVYDDQERSITEEIIVDETSETENNEEIESSVE